MEMRLIDADRLLEERRLHLYYNLPNGDTAIPIIDIKHAPTVNNGGWIPVTERIPADGSDILVYCDDGEESRIVACNYDNGVWFDCVFNTVMVFKNITHWMPLPEPPKEGLCRE